MAKTNTTKKKNFHGDYVLFRDKLIWVLVFLLLQLGFFIYMCLRLREQYIYISSIFSIISLIVVIYILNRPINPAYKLAWCIPILLVPIFGGLFYILLSVNGTRRKFRKSVRAAVRTSKQYLSQDETVLDEVSITNKQASSQMKCIYNQAKYPVYKNTSVQYFSSGEEMYPVLIEQLKKARHFIFMEYFIIHEGIFWNDILEVLKEKVKEGVEVKIIYDDMGCVRTLPYNYYETLRSFGIECYCFNPFNAMLSLRLNNRDHRKITVIDGYTSFTGGINLADEYINEHQTIDGYWKDTGIMLKGEATWNFSVMFLQFWNHLSKEEINYEKYRIDCDAYRKQYETDEPDNTDGYVQPYADNPLYDEIVAENVYLNIIHRATNYIYITTPYLIIDNEMITALTLAAASGVDVRIITPHVPDKKPVFMITRSFYEPLTKAGVKIYEFTPGFIHAKMMIADDLYCVIGSINLDYRSLYLHFECAALLYHSAVIKEVQEDILKTIEQSQEITYENCLALNKPYRFWLSLLRIYAPLM